jgi:hypothetical protein
MKVLIRNPAVENPNDQIFWGDFHYGLSLSRSLEELGCEVEIQYWPNWIEAEADVLLVLRGLRETEEIEGDFNTKTVWLISHPKDVPDHELRLFDVVLAGSLKHTKELIKRDFTAHQFLQCTDDRVFHLRSKKKLDFDNAFIFVGNCRGRSRSLLERAIVSHIPLRIWGKHWIRENDESFVVNRYYPNECLGDLYRNSFCTLNDHWEDMISYHYVNNRVFDALACGLPLLSEPNPGIDLLKFDGIKVVKPGESFDDAVDDFIVNYKHFHEAAFNDASLILEKHTFKARAQQFLTLIK